MAREPVAIDFIGRLGGGMGVERGTSSRGGSRLVWPVPGVPAADVHPLAAGVQTLPTMTTTTTSSVPEGFRDWVTRLDTSTGLLPSNPPMMAAPRLRSMESYGMTTTADAVGHAGVTRAKVVDSTGVPLVGPSLRLQHSVTQGNMVAAHSVARPPSVGKAHPGPAQLTIFYAGMVNVYDEIPFDKAQAIMVLAGRARAWASSSGTNVPGSCASGPRGEPSSPIAMSQPAQPVSRVGSPAPPQLTLTKPKLGATRVELPQARKASLARFLERRKDRLRTGPYTLATHDVTMRPNSLSLSTPRPSMPQNSTGMKMSSPSQSKENENT